MPEQTVAERQKQQRRFLFFPAQRLAQSQLNNFDLPKVSKDN